MRLTLSLTTFLKIPHLRKKENKLRQAKIKNINELKEGWKDKPFHGKYPIRACNPGVNSSLTHHWLASPVLKPDTADFIIAAQNQSLPTRNF